MCSKFNNSEFNEKKLWLFVDPSQLALSIFPPQIAQHCEITKCPFFAVLQFAIGAQDHVHEVYSLFPSPSFDSPRSRLVRTREPFSVSDIALRRNERRSTVNDERREEARRGTRARARDSWQPVAKGHEVLAPLLHAPPRRGWLP